MTKDLFNFNQARNPELEDDEYVLKSDENVRIQVCAYEEGTSYVLNEYGQDDPNNDATFWVKDCGEFQHLDMAMENAVRLGEKRAAPEPSGPKM